MVGTMEGDTKKKGQKQTTHKNQKERELIPLVVGSYFTNGPSNVICMQMMQPNSNGGFRCITRQCNLPFYSKG
jgi:hypothetical protein